MFRAFSLVVSFLCALAFPSPHTVKADVVYTAEGFTFSEPGWSFDGGTFTTDGSLGAISGANVGTVFTSWDLSFTSPAGSYTLTPLDSELAYNDWPGPATNLFATTTELVWPNVADPGRNIDSFHITTLTDSAGIVYLGARATGRTPSMFMFDNDNVYSVEDAGIGAPVAIASVPEPSAFLCLSLVGCVGVGTRWLRNRRTQV